MGCSALLGHLINAAVAGSFDDPPSEKDINEALAMVHGIGARDEVEGMLAVQMVGTQLRCDACAAAPEGVWYA